MTPIEVILIVIGIAILVISFFIIEQKDQKKSFSLDEQLGENLSIHELTSIKEHLNNVIHQVTEDTVEKTDSYLSQISNEKIMAVNEFSEEILEKIDHNHKEVVFLYQMLNEKESDLKKAIQEVNETKRQVQELSKKVMNQDTEEEFIVHPQYEREIHEQHNTKRTLEEEESLLSNKKDVKKSGTFKKTKDVKRVEDFNNFEDNKNVNDSNNIEDFKNIKDIKNIEENKRVKDSNKIEHRNKIESNDVVNNRTRTDKSMVEDRDSSMSHSSDHYQEILALAKEGKSVNEISKMLRIGHGEVKLVIDLNSNQGE